MHAVLHIACAILHTRLSLKMIPLMVKPATTQAQNEPPHLSPCDLKLCVEVIQTPHVAVSDWLTLGGT